MMTVIILGLIALAALGIIMLSCKQIKRSFHADPDDFADDSCACGGCLVPAPPEAEAEDLPADRQNASGTTEEPCTPQAP